jgi:hypothetical protein
MHSYALRVILNHSITLAAIIGISRFRSIAPAYFPFLFIIWLGLFNETLSLFIIYNNRSNAVNSNIFVLGEYLLILLQFYKWNYHSTLRYYGAAVAGVMVWVIDNCLLHGVSENNSLFRVYYSLAVVFLSINQVNKLIIFEKGNLLRNATFIICIAFLFYFGCKGFIETFNALRFGLSDMFLRNLWIILYFVTFITNLIYAIATLCIPAKQEFTLPY